MNSKLRNALVTGSTSGIGQAIAETLAARGLRVIVSGRDSSRGATVVNTIRARGGDAQFLAADLAAPAGAVELAAAAQSALGSIDILVNNAGVFAFGPTAGTTLVDYESMYASNVRAPYFLTARLAPPMAARGWGRVINITTMVAHFGMVGGALYGSTKAALELLTKSWAAEFGPSGVTVNSVAPGPILTRGTEGMGEAIAELGKATPVGRPGKSTEIAEAVAFLVSEGAAYVNGATLPVDGGRTAV